MRYYTPSSEVQRLAVEAKRNHERMQTYRARREIIVTGRLRTASAVIRQRLAGYTHYQIEQAIRRARETLEAGATVQQAVTAALDVNRTRRDRPC